jgi:transcriptional regulator with XRE-family HTH domain
MARDLKVLLGAALRDIRKRSARTQDAWSDRTGMSQSYLSSAERGTSGWESVQTFADAIESVGEDPIELLRLAVAHADQTGPDLELIQLWSAAPEHVRAAILTLLRTQVRATSAVR